MLTQEKLNALVKEVQNELYGIIAYNPDVEFSLCKSTSYLGRCFVYKNKITISQYLEGDQLIKNVIAHELIHSCGVTNHKEDFKELMNLVNNSGWGYNVCTSQRNNNQGNTDNLRELRKQKKEKREAKAKSYIVWCESCGYHYISKRKCHVLRKYRCPECYGKLRQKLYKKGKTTITRKLF